MNDMKANVKVEIYPDVINKLGRAKTMAFEKTVDWILSDIIARQVVPFDTGAMRSSGWTESRESAEQLVGYVIFNTPYARRWYFNAPNEKGNVAHFQTTHNANAQDHWMDYYLDGEGLQLIKDNFSRFFKEAAGGLVK